MRIDTDTLQEFTERGLIHRLTLHVNTDDMRVDKAGADRQAKFVTELADTFNAMGDKADLYEAARKVAGHATKRIDKQSPA